MTRTNIDIDDELVHAVMRRHHLPTKKAAVELALRRMVGPKLDVALLDEVSGIGWEGDLDDMRASRVDPS